MAGGTWDVMDKPLLPGMYMNFVAKALAAIQTNARGVVVVPIRAQWGPVHKFIEVENEGAIYNLFLATKERDTDTCNAYKALFLALLGQAKKIRAYRLAGNTASSASVELTSSETNAEVLNALAEDINGKSSYYLAKAQENKLLLETRYPTDLPFSITVKPSLADSTAIDLKFYLETELLQTITVTGKIEAVTNKTFTNGNAGISDLTNLEYVKALNEFEKYEFNLAAFDTTDEALQTSIATWLKRMRNQGKKIMVVMGGNDKDDTAEDAVEKTVNRSAAFDHEGIINVGTGVVLDGTTYASAELSSFVAGAIAGQKMSESITYFSTAFDAVTRQWTKTEREEAIKNGVLVLYHDGRQVKILSGRNSLMRLSQDMNNTFKKIRPIRTMDAIDTDLQVSAEDNYIGKVNNTEEKRLALVGAYKGYMRTLAQGGVIEPEEGRDSQLGWDVWLHEDYHGSSATMIPEPDEVYVKYEARITDTIEKIFGTFIVK